MATVVTPQNESAPVERSRRARPWNRFIHRVLGLFASLLLLYIACTGIGMQILDLKAILTHESPTDAQELSMQEGMYGPANFAVIQVSDFTAPALPQDFDLNKGIVTVLQAVHAQQNPEEPGGPGAGGHGAKVAGSGPGARAGAGSNGGQNSGQGGQARPGGRSPGGQGRGPGGGQAGGGGQAASEAPYNPLQWVELRMDNGIPIGQAMVGTRLMAFNAQTGEAVTPVPPKSIPQGGALPPSLRQKLKTLHRFWNRQDTPGVYWEFISGIILWTMIISGLVMYFRLWGTRWRQGRQQPFWMKGGGGWWRGMHRVISVLAAVFLMWMAFTGTWIGFESSYGPIKRVFASKPVVLNPTPIQAAAAVVGAGVVGNGGQQGQPGGGQLGQPTGGAQAGGRAGQQGGGAGRGPGGGLRNPLDFIYPLRDTEVREMTAVTLNSMKQIHPTLPIKAIRLRTYGETKQGVIISGGDRANQYVFNADTGQPASLNEQGYTASGFPFGTQVHENIKHLHSGDYFGIPTRLMNLFAGFSLAFLSLSGLWIYFDMFRKRLKGGRKSPIWL